MVLGDNRNLIDYTLYHRAVNGQSAESARSSVTEIWGKKI